MKSPTLVIILLSLLIFLGIFWLTTKRVRKEGLTGSDITNIFNDKLLAAGIDATTYTSAIPGALDKVTALIKSETAGIDGVDGIDGTVGANELPPPDLSEVVDTTGKDYHKNATYFAGKRFSDGFCKMYSSNAVTRNDKCGMLTNENCNETDCCILLNGKKCVAGDSHGPTFDVDDQGKDVDYKYYTYKNNCYGHCGKDFNEANPCDSYASTDTNINDKCIKYLWSETGCPNKKYVTPGVSSSLQSYSKAAIDVKFKRARTDEPNYAKCYGPDEVNWPEPCDNTTSTSTKLSSRCLKKLFTDAGCTNTATVNADYATQNNSVPKRVQMNTFNGWVNAMPLDTASLTKCYGPDPLAWPDPCADTTDASINLTPQCMSKLAITSACSNPKFSDTVITQEFIMNNSNTSKGAIKTKFNDYSRNWNNDRMQTCYGDDKNKWPFINTVGNSGLVSCNRYCQGHNGHSWNYEMPSSWKGATAVAAGLYKDLPLWWRWVDQRAGYLPCTCTRNDPAGYSWGSMEWAAWWGYWTNT
jgi:hypothetical protein